MDPQVSRMPVFHRLFDKRRKEERQRQIMLLQWVRQAHEELRLARENFDSATDPCLIEMFTYQIKAAEKRCDFLRRKYKESRL